MSAPQGATVPPQPRPATTYALRKGQTIPEPTAIQILTRTKDGGKAYVVTRYQSDGGVHSQGWRATGKADEAAISPFDVLGGAPRLGLSAVRALRPGVASGEDMINRVIPKALEERLAVYKPMGAGSEAEWMEHNRAWIQKMMNQRRKIFDVGPAPGRDNFPDPTSAYYKMERAALAAAKYRKYRKLEP